MKTRLSPSCAGLTCGLCFVAAVLDGSRSPDSTFELLRIDGPPIVARLTSLAPGWKFQFHDGSPLPVAGWEIESLRRPNDRTLAGPAGAQLVLGNGDRLRGTPKRCTQEVIEIESELFAVAKVPLERVSAILFDGPKEARACEQLCRELTRGPRPQDRAVLANGDSITGTLLGFSDAAVRIEVSGAATELKRPTVRAIALSSALSSFPKPSALYAQVLLSDGSVLSLFDAQLADTTLHGKAAFGGDVALPIEHVRAIEFRNGRVTYLSDLEPADFRHRPYFGLEYGYERDRSIGRNPLALAGRPFRKGLGVHSQSELTYTLDAGFQRLEATVGIDDETAGQGSVVFRVLVDDKLAFESTMLTGASNPLPISVPVFGAKRLRLQVDFATQGDVLDHADWAGARLVR
jgi:hypothetical protein